MLPLRSGSFTLLLELTLVVSPFFDEVFKEPSFSGSFSSLSTILLVFVSEYFLELELSFLELGLSFSELELSFFEELLSSTLSLELDLSEFVSDFISSDSVTELSSSATLLLEFTLSLGVQAQNSVTALIRHKINEIIFS